MQLLSRLIPALAVLALLLAGATIWNFIHGFVIEDRIEVIERKPTIVKRYVCRDACRDEIVRRLRERRSQNESEPRGQESAPDARSEGGGSEQTPPASGQPGPPQGGQPGNGDEDGSGAQPSGPGPQPDPGVADAVDEAAEQATDTVNETLDGATDAACDLTPSLPGAC